MGQRTGRRLGRGGGLTLFFSSGLLLSRLSAGLSRGRSRALARQRLTRARNKQTARWGGAARERPLQCCWRREVARCNRASLPLPRIVRPQSPSAQRLIDKTGGVWPRRRGAEEAVSHLPIFPASCSRLLSRLCLSEQPYAQEALGSSMCGQAEVRSRCYVGGSHRVARRQAQWASSGTSATKHVPKSPRHTRAACVLKPLAKPPPLPRHSHRLCVSPGIGQRHVPHVCRLLSFAAPPSAHPRSCCTRGTPTGGATQQDVGATRAGIHTTLSSSCLQVLQGGSGVHPRAAARPHESWQPDQSPIAPRSLWLRRLVAAHGKMNTALPSSAAGTTRNGRRHHHGCRSAGSSAGSAGIPHLLHGS